MKRYIFVGLLLFTTFAVMFAPASIVVRLVGNTMAYAELTSAQGTLWQGSSTLLIERRPLGQLMWDFRPASLLRLQPTYDWSLNDPEVRLAGFASIDATGFELHASGSFNASAINPWLTQYDIDLRGIFELAPTTIKLSHPDADGQPTLKDAHGQLNWSGGVTRYTLSGLTREVLLPTISAYLEFVDGAAQATAFTGESDIPLLIAGPGATGFFKVSITKHFTKLLRSPWPGSDPDHTIVLEVEQQLY